MKPIGYDKKWNFFLFFTLMTLVHVLIIIGVSFRVIQVRLPVATSLAWLILVFFLPLVGAIAYLVLGEKRLGQKFSARTRAIKARYDNWLQDLPPEIRSDLQGLSPQARSLSRLTVTTANIPALSRQPAPTARCGRTDSWLHDQRHRPC